MEDPDASLAAFAQIPGRPAPNADSGQDQEDNRRDANPQAPVVEAAHVPDITEKLGTLAEMHASGTLSDEEFAVAKARLLGSSSR
jgi:hypothetical protein